MTYIFKIWFIKYLSTSFCVVPHRPEVSVLWRTLWMHTQLRTCSFEISSLNRQWPATDSWSCINVSQKKEKKKKDERAFVWLMNNCLRQMCVWEVKFSYLEEQWSQSIRLQYVQWWKMTKALPHHSRSSWSKQSIYRNLIRGKDSQMIIKTQVVPCSFLSPCLL